MANRERRRTERRKRKRRSIERDDQAVGAEPERSFQERASSRSEERNAAVRATLEPLEPGERPGVVTVGAMISALLALVFTVSAVIAATGAIEVSGEEPAPGPLAIFGAALWLMAWGMWRARYWAVLGFQMLLVLVLVATALGLVQVETITQLIATLALLLGAGALFFFMIRAMARIQMPEPPRRR